MSFIWIPFWPLQPLYKRIVFFNHLCEIRSFFYRPLSFVGTQFKIKLIGKRRSLLVSAGSSVCSAARCLRRQWSMVLIAVSASWSASSSAVFPGRSVPSPWSLFLYPCIIYATGWKSPAHMMKGCHLPFQTPINQSINQSIRCLVTSFQRLLSWVFLFSAQVIVFPSGWTWFGHSPLPISPSPTHTHTRHTHPYYHRILSSSPSSGNHCVICI